MKPMSNTITRGLWIWEGRTPKSTGFYKITLSFVKKDVVVLQVGKKINRILYLRNNPANEVVFGKGDMLIIQQKLPGQLPLILLHVKQLSDRNDSDLDTSLLNFPIHLQRKIKPRFVIVLATISTVLTFVGLYSTGFLATFVYFLLTTTLPDISFATLDYMPTLVFILSSIASGIIGGIAYDLFRKAFTSSDEEKL